jgi:hypothetical protein
MFPCCTAQLVEDIFKSIISCPPPPGHGVVMKGSVPILP